MAIRALTLGLLFALVGFQATAQTAPGCQYFPQDQHVHCGYGCDYFPQDQRFIAQTRVSAPIEITR